MAVPFFFLFPFFFYLQTFNTNDFILKKHVSHDQIGNLIMYRRSIIFSPFGGSQNTGSLTESAMDPPPRPPPRPSPPFEKEFVFFFQSVVGENLPPWRRRTS